LVLEDKAREEMKDEGLITGHLEISHSIDIKYSGQIHELTIPVPRQLWTQEEVTLKIREMFIDKYQKLYGKGSAYTKGGIELVALNVDILGRLQKPLFETERSSEMDVSGAIKTYREAYFKDMKRFIKTPIYDMQQIQHGHHIQGPAIIESSKTTVVILPHQEGVIDGFLNVVIDHWGKEANK